MKHFTSELSFSVKDTQIRKWNTSESWGFSLSLLCWVAHHFGNSVCNKNVLMTLKRVWRTCIISTLAQEIRTCEQILSCHNNPPSALDSNTVPSEGNRRSRALSFQLKAGNLNLRAEKKKKSFIWVLGSFRNLDVLLWFIVQPRSSCLSVSEAGRWGQDPFSTSCVGGEIVSIFSLADFGLC